VNFLDELRNLDFNDIGRWPFLFRAIFVGLFFVVVVGVGFYFLVYNEQMPRLERAEQEERELRASFEQKQKPGKTEIPNLLVDISQTGLAAGLQEELFQPLSEIQKDFYAEKPIKIRLKGSYHEFGKFVSDIAALPRIVTLHDIEIGRESGDSTGEDLVLKVTAKTYRYMEDEEAVEAESSAG